MRRASAQHCPVTPRSLHGVAARVAQRRQRRCAAHMSILRTEQDDTGPTIRKKGRFCAAHNRCRPAHGPRCLQWPKEASREGAGGRATQPQPGPADSPPPTLRLPTPLSGPPTVCQAISGASLLIVHYQSPSLALPGAYPVPVNSRHISLLRRFYIRISGLIYGTFLGDCGAYPGDSIAWLFVLSGGN